MHYHIVIPCAALTFRLPDVLMIVLWVTLDPLVEQVRVQSYTSLAVVAQRMRGRAIADQLIIDPTPGHIKGKADQRAMSQMQANLPKVLLGGKRTRRRIWRRIVCEESRVSGGRCRSLALFWSSQRLVAVYVGPQGRNISPTEKTLLQLYLNLNNHLCECLGTSRSITEQIPAKGILA